MNIKTLRLVAVSICLASMVLADDSDVADFDFEPAESADIFSDDEVPAESRVDSIERRVDLDVMDEPGDEADVGTVNAFVEKEQQIRSALQRATKQGVYTKKFAQILPIMRALNKPQKIVLASLISAQASALPGKGLNLQQVESMFGERRSLILPILFDIANLVRSASTSQARAARNLLADVDHIPQSEFLKHAYIPLDQHTNSAKLNTSILTTEPDAQPSYIRDDRLQIDDDDINTTRNLIHRSSGPELVTHPIPLRDDPKAAQLSAKVTELMRSRRLDQRSYHERKLNMTNFNGSTDQFAMESEGVPIQITLPRSPMAPELSEQGLTLEQYEDLALRDLNDTDISEMMLRNETTGELLPLPEMLISRYRNKNNPYRKLLAGSNSIESIRTCERFGALCLRVEDYPMQAIMGSIRRHKHAMSALLAEFIDKEGIEYSKNDEVKRREDDELTPTGMCPSVIRYARPQKARSATGEWKYIVNTGQHTQTLRLEKCTKAEESCTYLTDNFRSRCVQVFNYHRLLSWDHARGLHIDIFKVPTCCSCHIDSYKEKFPPISSYSGGQDDHGFSASNIHTSHQLRENHHHSPAYSTITSDESDIDEDEDSIAYQYSNGFKRSQGKQSKYRDTLSSGSISKPRYEKNRKPTFQSSPSLDSYLTPPTSDTDFDFVSPFKRGGTSSSSFSDASSGLGSIDIGVSNRKRRRPVRTNNRDQIIAGSDFLPDYSVIQSHDSNTERSNAQSQAPTGLRKPTTQSLTPDIGSGVGPSSFISSSPSFYSTSSSSSPTASIVHRLSTQGRPSLPSISTASTSAVDLGKRVNYNYHPIIDFFGDSLKSEKEIDDRVGFSDSRTWRPVHVTMRRRQR